MIVCDICDPDRIRRLGVEGVRRFVAHRGVTAVGPQISSGRRSGPVALRLPTAERAVLGRVLAADFALLTILETEIAVAEAALAEVVGDTPAGVLTSPARCRRGPSVELRGGDRRSVPIPQRRSMYRSAGLSPPPSKSAGRARPRSAHRREGSVELRRRSSSSGGACRSTTRTSPPTATLSSTPKSQPVAAVAVGRRGPSPRLRHARYPAAL